MATITGFTAARMLAIEAASVISGVISGDNLILEKFDGSEINAGNVRGPQGDQGIPGLSGERWFSGAGVPAGNLADSGVGDWYLNTTNGDVYEKTGAAAWTLRMNIMPGRPSVVTTLPAVTAANHGLEVLLRVDEAEVYGGPYLWLCKYMHFKADGVTLNNKTHKWDVIQASALRKGTYHGVQQTSPAVAFTPQLITNSPSIALPRSGDYEIGVQGSLSANAAHDLRLMAAVANDFAGGSSGSHFANGAFHAHGYKYYRYPNRVANELVRASITSSSTSLPVTPYDIEVSATPIRIS